MHSFDIVHRDVKPENLLINKQGLLKICDFGFARMLPKAHEEITDYVATRWYRAPEIILKANKYNSPVDIFAMGCIIAELFLM